MKHRNARMLAATALWLLSSLGALDASATSVIPLDLDQITAGARHIVHVRCTGNEVQPDAAIGAVTLTTFVALDRVKGHGAGTFLVRQAGGELNGIAVDYHVPKFIVGNEYVLFMPQESSLGLASPVGLSQGMFAVQQGVAGKEAGNGTDFALLLSAADRVAAPAGMAARLQQAPSHRVHMDLAEFKALVRTKAGKQ